MKQRSTVVHSLMIIIYFLLLLWVVEAINAMSGHRLCQWGILPRNIGGLPGIIFAPFLHGSVLHLLFNSGPLAILGALVILHGKSIFFKISLLIIILGGFGVWLFGRGYIHVGASGLIFGYFGYLASRGIFKKSIGSLLVSLITISAYGGMIFKMMPAGSQISWEGHLAGFAAGILAAKLE